MPREDKYSKVIFDGLYGSWEMWSFDKDAPKNYKMTDKVSMKCELCNEPLEYVISCAVDGHIDIECKVCDYIFEFGE